MRLAIKEGKLETKEQAIQTLKKINFQYMLATILGMAAIFIDEKFTNIIIILLLVLALLSAITIEKALEKEEEKNTKEKNN